ncbi:UxaA family hydrolase [Sporosarcina aquimarina]|uniref:UxaA family hydrolase n=1 Tax=Sporosarcina aquimarina TaxID=114975 RepID=UPI001C8DF1E4|nr:UxaA family hydrolase [Sporosarcina aquimarina]MBY0223180.1 UxaA family hydrolase [Sporosarcina aquimarina]
MEVSYNALRLHPKDNVAVALQYIGKGETVLISNFGEDLIATEEISYGHKISIQAIKENEEITKYGECMGKATEEIPLAAHVHVHNVRGLNENERADIIHHMMKT